MALGALLLVGPLAPPASAATPVPTLDTTFASLLNGLRGTLGLGSLAVDGELSSIARAWSVQMADSGTLSHNGALKSQVQGWSKVGENVGFGGTATQIFNALVASPPHMRNMSDRDFTRIGVGTVTDRQGRIWTTHVFMRPEAAAAAPAASPTAPAARKAAPPTTATPTPTPATAAPTTAPASTAPPPTAAPTTAAPPTTVAPLPEVEVASEAPPTDASPPPTPVLVSASRAPARGIPAPLLVGFAVIGLLALGGAGFAMRRSS